MTEQQTQPAFGYREPKKQKGSKRWWILALVALGILGLGTCSWTFYGLFQQMLDRQAATTEFMQDVYTNGIPAADSEVYHPDGQITQSAIDGVKDLAQPYGTPIEIGSPSCTVRVSANTTASENGSFADCTAMIEYSVSSGRFDTYWKKQDETWKVLGFYLHFDEAIQEPETEAALSESADQSTSALDPEPE